jgi:hypothetical protein
MNTWLIIMIAVAVIIVGLAIFMIVAQRKKKEISNYRSWFFIGICWIPQGVVFKNVFFLVMGVVFAVVGLLNKNKWKEGKKWSDLTSAEKRIKFVLIAVVTVLFIAMVVIYFITRGKTV